MGQLQGKVAIVTGAGSGFGEGMATAYVREGAKIIIADLNAEAGERVAKALGTLFPYTTLFRSRKSVV